MLIPLGTTFLHKRLHIIRLSKFPHVRNSHLPGKAKVANSGHINNIFGEGEIVENPVVG